MDTRIDAERDYKSSGGGGLVPLQSLHGGACTDVSALICMHGVGCTVVSARRCLHGGACTEGPARQCLHGGICTERSPRQCLHGEGCTEVLSRRARHAKRRKTAPRPQAGNRGSLYFLKNKRRSPHIARYSCKKTTNGERGKDKELSKFNLFFNSRIPIHRSPSINIRKQSTKSTHPRTGTFPTSPPPSAKKTCYVLGLVCVVLSHWLGGAGGRRCDSSPRRCLHGGACTEGPARRGLHGGACTERPARQGLHGGASAEGSARRGLHGGVCTAVPARRGLHGGACTEGSSWRGLHGGACTEPVLQWRDSQVHG